MKAVVLTEHSEEPIALQEMPTPDPKKGEVRVALKAAALNRRDQWIREGKYPNIQPNTILGSDGSGIVDVLGEGVPDHWKGKEVLINPNIDWGENPEVQSAAYHILGMPTNGTMAEYVIVKQDRLIEKPSFLSWEEAAALPLAGLTAYRAVFTHGGITADKKVLISGAGGGVAQFAFMFAKAVGAQVSVTSGSEGKRQHFLEEGASSAFDYREEGWSKQALKETGGFDVVIDSAGGEGMNDFVKMMRPAGRIVFYGATRGLPPNMDLYRMFWNQITLQGSTMGNDEEFKQMIALVSERGIHPMLAQVRAFDSAIMCFDEMKAGQGLGKYVLTI